MKYIIITPVYNENKYISAFIESILEQTVLPLQLILVDDNSTDGTAEIIKSYAKLNPWITYFYHGSSDNKAQGKKVINAFNFGLKNVAHSQIDFISKIDSDLTLPPFYFEKIIEVFENDNQLGICGGVIAEQKDGNWIDIPQASYHIRGALKSYRTQCFAQIGGLLPVLGWDGLDEMNALYKGWHTKIIPISVKHYRPAAIDYDKKQLNFSMGYANYQNGGNLFLAIVRSLVKLKQKPFLLVSAAYMKGFLQAKQQNAEKNVDVNLAKFINKFHIKRLLGFKRY